MNFPEIRDLSSVNVWDYENGFYWFSSPTRINKLLAHYELYKSIIKLPGDVFELGVYKAASLIRLATFRQTLENDFSRRIVGFDAFGAFPTDNLTLSEDKEFIENFEGVGGLGLKKSEIIQLFSAKGFSNIFLEQGNIFDSLPEYLKQNPHTRISFLHLDLDVKEPTEYALDMLYERVVPNGLIVFDDYNAVAGESLAVDRFLKKYRLSIEKLPFYKVPAFVKKRF